MADLRRFTMQEEKRSGTRAARKLLNEIQEKVRSLSSEFDQIYNQVMEELKKRKIFFVAEKDLTDKQSAWLRDHSVVAADLHSESAYLSDNDFKLEFR